MTARDNIGEPGRFRTTRNRVLGLVGVRPEEAGITLLMVLYFFLAMACVATVKSIQNALYLGRIGFSGLPVLYLILALVSGLIVVVFRSVSGKDSSSRVRFATLTGLMLCIVLFLFLLTNNGPWVYPVFYVWGGIFSLLVPTLGWMLAYELFTIRQARRVFSVLATGGILGGAAGAGYAALTVDWVGSLGLLVQVAVALVLMQAVLWALEQRRTYLGLLGQRREGGESGRALWRGERLQKSSFKSLVGSRYLVALAALVLTSACASTLIDLQYKWFLEAAFTGSEDSITKFFAGILSITFLISALFQLLLTNRILKGSGVVVGLLVLPLSLVTGSIAMVIFATFAAMVILKAVDSCLRSSVDKASTELLYVPLGGGPETMAAKSAIDLMVYRFGDALGAGLFLGVTALTAGSIRATTIALLGIAVVLTLLAVRVGAEYLRMLRQHLERRHGSAEFLRVEMDELATQDTLLEALKSRTPSKVQFALHQLLDRNRYQRAGDIPVKVVNAVAPLVWHIDHEVAAAALHLLVRYQPSTYLNQIRVCCDSREAPDTQYLFYMDRYLENPDDFLQPDFVMEWSRGLGPAKASVLARLMGKSKDDRYRQVLRDWIRHSDKNLAREAVRALGMHKQDEDLELLISLLGETWSMRVARAALANFGDDLMDRLLDLLRAPEVSITIKREVPLLLEEIGSPLAIEGLITSLYQPDSIVAFRALKCLVKIRFDQDLPYGEQTFSPVLQIWAREYYELVNMSYLVGAVHGKSDRLLKKAIEERIEWTIEKMFRGLELFLPPGDAYFSYRGFVSHDSTLREHAIELIDLRVKGELRQTMQPIFTADNPGEVVRAGRRLFNLSTDLDHVFSEAFYSADPWLKCCIIVAVKSQGRENLRDRVERCSKTIHPIVCETAQWALETWGQQGSKR